MAAKRALFLLALCLPLGGCGGADVPGDQARNRVVAVAPAPAPVDCMHGLPPGPPEAVARAAVQRGDHRVYRYGENGEAYQFYVAGYERCTGSGLAWRNHVDGTLDQQAMQDDTLELGEIRDRSQPLDNCADCDFPLSQCGRVRIAYAARYNRELFRLGLRRPAPSCPQPPATSH